MLLIDDLLMTDTVQIRYLERTKKLYLEHNTLLRDTKTPQEKHG